MLRRSVSQVTHSERIHAEERQMVQEHEQCEPRLD